VGPILARTYICTHVDDQVHQAVKGFEAVITSRCCFILQAENIKNELMKSGLQFGKSGFYSSLPC